MSLLIGGELVLYGFVGDDFWDEGFTDHAVLLALAEHGHDQELTVRLNSGGGYIAHGVAIYNALKAHAGRVTVVVDAVAASSASIIAMAGDVIRLRQGARMMIHEPSGFSGGTAEDLSRDAREIDQIADQMAQIYAARSGEDPVVVRAAMKDTLWMDGPEAVQRGFATETDAAQSATVAAFAYDLYAHAPADLVSAARENRWLASDMTRARTRHTQPQEANTMPNSTGGTPAPQTPPPVASATAAATAADPLDRVRAILASDAGKANPELAQYLALETGLSAEQADGVMARASAPAQTSAQAWALAPGVAPQAPTQPTAQAGADAYTQGRIMATQGLARPVTAGGEPEKAAVTAKSVLAARRQARAKITKKGG